VPSNSRNLDLMRYIPHLLCAIGFLALVFAYWGINTVAGRRQFDEMAGMIPFGVGVLGALTILIGIVWLIVRLRL
jgi:hypothetical protein